MKISELYKPYFKAVRKVMSGKPVRNLERIRIKCNGKANAETNRATKYGNYPNAMVVYFVSDAENKILMGANPDKFYNFSDKSSPSKFREKCRKFLEVILENYSF